MISLSGMSRIRGHGNGNGSSKRKGRGKSQLCVSHLFDLDQEATA